MIKVLRKKNKAKCIHCGSLLKYEHEDIIEHKYHSDSLDPYYYIKCPVCNGKVRISD